MSDATSVASDLGVAMARLGDLLFGVVGSGPSFHLVDAFADAGGTYVPTADEAAAGLAAAGAWRASGRPSAAVTIKGPGLTNALPAIAFAHLERRPLLTVSEANPGSDLPPRRHKHLPHRELVRPLVRRWSEAGAAVASVDGLVATAVEQGGPVHVDLVVGSELEDVDPPGEPWVEAHLQRVEPSRRPAIVLGRSCVAESGLLDLRSLGIPVFTTAAARGALDDDVPGAAGVFTGAGGPASTERAILDEADAVVAVGVSAAELLAEPPEGWVPLPATDVGAAVDALRGLSWGTDLVDDARARERKVLRSPGWWPGDVAEALDAVDRPMTVVADTGSFCTFIEHLVTTRPGRRWDGSPSSRYMGTAIPLGLGCSLAQGEPVVCVVGDGGAPRHVAELRIASERRLRLCVLVVADGRYTSVRGGAAAATRTPDTDWCAVARAVGCDARRVVDRDALDAALQDWRRDGPVLLECRFEAWDPAPLTEVRA